MSNIIKPNGYRPLLDRCQTELGIKKIKDFFQQNLSTELRLQRVTAPLFVMKGLGINDDLNGVERAVKLAQETARARGGAMLGSIVHNAGVVHEIEARGMRR